MCEKAKEEIKIGDKVVITDVTNVVVLHEGVVIAYTSKLAEIKEDTKFFPRQYWVSRTNLQVINNK